MSEKFEKEPVITIEASERLSWNRPTVTTFDVMSQTEGGIANANSPGDDAWYVS